MTTETTLRSRISGTYDLRNLDRLRGPFAWSGFVSDKERHEQEADLAELTSEIRDMLDDPYNDTIAVVVEDGQIVDTISDR